MNKFISQLSNDNEFLDLIWINYLENREFREQISEFKWNELYTGNVTVSNFKKISGLNSLNKFIDFTTNNENATTYLIKMYLKAIKNNYNKVFNLAELKEVTEKNNEDSDYTILWDKINNNIQSIFDLEYEKMSKLLDTFGDVKIFDKLDWNLDNIILEDIKKIEKYSKYISKNEILVNFLEKIGKVNSLNKTRVLKNNSKKYTNEYFEIDYANDLSRILNSELTQFHNKYLRKRFYARYIEKRLMCYSVNKNELNDEIKTNRQNGPIIVCVDTSNSMEGFPELIAKSTLLYLINSSLKQDRNLYLINFSSINQIDELDINNISGIFDFIKRSFRGSTDFQTPISRAFEIIENNKFSNSDILFISDGLGEISKEFFSNINTKKEKSNTKIFSIILGEKNLKLDFGDSSIYIASKGSNISDSVVSVYDTIGHYSFLDRN